LCGIHGAHHNVLPLPIPERTTAMLDLFYVASTIAFFAMLLLYVRFCERLGRSKESEEKAP
jgi:hypothetical protein